MDCWETPSSGTYPRLSPGSRHQYWCIVNSADTQRVAGMLLSGVRRNALYAQLLCNPDVEKQPDLGPSS